METKQTAVEWLEDELAKNLKHIVLKEDYIFMESLFEQAKQIEKEQIKLAFNESRKIQDSDEISITHDWNNSEQYYNKTYNQQES